MKTSWIFTSAAVLADAGVIVIVAGVLVAWTKAPVIGTAVGLNVLGGAVRILRLL